MQIGFIGCGRVGTSLAKYFKEKKLNLVGVYDRTARHGQETADFVQTKYFDSKTQLISQCDIVFVTVSDSALATVWDEISRLQNSYLKDKVFVHCSGALSSSVFSHSDESVTVCSLHPAGAFHDKYESYKSLPSMVLTLEYDDRHNNANIGRIKNLLDLLGSKYTTISAENKVKYHAACVMASNLVVALMETASLTIGECGIPQEISGTLLGSLMLGNAQNIATKGTVNALTGPIDRADSATIKAHLETLTGQTKQIYIDLSKVLVDIAKIKNPERDYCEIEKLLNN